MTLARLSPWQSFNEFFVSIVYFVQGSAGLTSIASAIILREQLGLDFYQMGLIGVASTLPWSVKPLFGLLTDLVPIRNFRRRPYLHIGPLLGFLGYLLIALYANSFESFFLALILANLGLALTDVATDGFVVEESNSKNAARIQGLTQASIRIAAFVTSFFSGLLIYSEILSPHQMYLVVAIFPLITFLASFFINEKKADENNPEYSQTKKIDYSIFSAGYIASIVAIFTLIILNLVFGSQIDAYLAEQLLSLSRMYFTIFIWFLFGVWMVSYFTKLKKLNLTSSMIFLAILFILLWRINPGTGSSMFFYLKDTLLINEKTLGFIDTIAQLGSILGVILAVKIFDKIRLKKLLLITVLIAAVYGTTSFAVTHPDWGNWLGNLPVLSWVGAIVAVPVYFFDSLFSFLFLGEAFTNPLTAAFALSSMEKFLYIQSIFAELIFMIAYIPLLKFAVLITPKKAEATNFAIITSIMNVGLAISAWLSGYLYNYFMGFYYPDLPVTTVQVDIIDILIWINILSSATCLLVLPFLKTERFVKD